jgi:hypothetical protein
MLEQTGQMLKQDVVNRLERFKERFRRKVLWLEGLILALLTVLFFGLTIWAGYWEGLALSLPFLDLLVANPYIFYGSLVVLLSVLGYAHIRIRRWAAAKVTAKLLAEVEDSDLHPNYRRAFQKNSRWWRSILWPIPAGCGKRTAARLEKVLDDSNAYIQKLNDEYTNPSGRDSPAREYALHAPGDLQAASLSNADTVNLPGDKNNSISFKN